MGMSGLIGAGLIIILGMIGVRSWQNRSMVITEEQRKILFLTGGLQAVHVLFFVSGLLTRFNVYVAFVICAGLSVICFGLSIWLLAKVRQPIKYLFALLAVFQLFATVIIFLLPEAGIPAPIQF